MSFRFRIGLLAGVLCAWTQLSSAQPFLSVTSSTDGNGLFTYTFGMANPSYLWGVFTNDAFLLPSYPSLITLGSPEVLRRSHFSGLKWCLSRQFQYC